MDSDSATDPRRLKDAWSLPDDVVYLNHGSFGPSPRIVQAARDEWSARLERQPMDFLLRRCETHLDEALAELARLVHADPADLVFVDNATFGMNVVAASVPLGPGDEVLLTDHEYGAVRRIWQRACRKAGANLVVRSLPDPLSTADELVARFAVAITDRTRLVVVSHVTSPTAAIFPVEAIVRAAHARGAAVCIDGPHAIGMIPVDLRRLDADYYVASLHKWLSAPFGSGFLHVARRMQPTLEPPVTSWGGSVSGRPPCWKDEFVWLGTRDPAAFLAVPTAIRFLADYGWDDFRRCTHELARYARERLERFAGRAALVPDDPAWYGSMVTVPLEDSPPDAPPGGQRDPLQIALWERHRIEVPIVHWKGRRCVRVSCHLYNDRADVDRLLDALAFEFPRRP